MKKSESSLLGRVDLGAGAFGAGDFGSVRVPCAWALVLALAECGASDFWAGVPSLADFFCPWMYESLELLDELHVGLSLGVHLLDGGGAFLGVGGVGLGDLVDLRDGG
ncbi:MAG TPA: hypothetical protein PLE80_05575, partial [Opitutaceae bacterium]|nr:hypothetical protein [Opitutaceae bacterium]